MWELTVARLLFYEWLRAMKWPGPSSKWTIKNLKKPLQACLRLVHAHPNPSRKDSNVSVCKVNITSALAKSSQNFLQELNVCDVFLSVLFFSLVWKAVESKELWCSTHELEQYRQNRESSVIWKYLYIYSIWISICTGFKFVYLFIYFSSILPG